MEILWKVYWISWLFLLSSKYSCVDGNETTTFTPQSSIHTTTSMTTEQPDEKNDDRLKSQGDLDLETQDQVAILKQINRVNDDGSYTFGYEAADGSFKIETRDVNGNVKGMFGFINENGELKRVSYSASNGTGFQSTGTLNVPPLPGTTLSSDEDDNIAKSRHEHLIRVREKVEEDTSTKITLLDSTTPIYQNLEPSRLPIYIYGSSTPTSQVTSSSRPVVIQHIPKVRPTPASSGTIPTESEEILLKPLLSDLAPKRTSNTNFISFGTGDIPVSEATTTEENSSNPSVIQVIRPRTGPYKKVIVTKRPVITTTPKVITTTEYKSKEYLEKLKNKGSKAETGNGVRRQLGITNNYVTSTTANLVTSGTEDSPDVYGGKNIARPYPTSAYRTLFSQVPQHQRILQNSFLQNRNNYLTAALGNPNIPTTSPPPQVLPSTTPVPVRAYTGATNPQDANVSPVQPTYIPTPVTLPASDIQSQRPLTLPPSYVAQYPPASPSLNSASPTEPLPQQIYIPPILLEHLIRMLIVAQQRLISQRQQQQIGPFQQAVVGTLGPTNVPPELLPNRYDPRYYQPQVTTYPYADPMPSRTPYDPNIPYPVSYYQGYAPLDPRYVYQSQMYTPVPYSRYHPRTLPYEVDPNRQQQADDFVLRMLYGGYQRYHSQGPVLALQPTSNVVERSPTYQPITKDSSASSTTPSPKVGQVRNVEILGQIGEESQTSVSYERSTKAEQ